MQLTEIIRNVRLGIKDLMIHGLRSLLTMLGMVFGVGSVVAMLSVGEGAGKEALEQIQKLGSNNIIIDSVKPVEQASSSKGRFALDLYGLRYKDFERMVQAIADIKSAVPVKITREKAYYADNVLEVRVVGSTPDWFQLVDHNVLSGRVFQASDMSNRANVVVVTENVARKLLTFSGEQRSNIRIGSNFFEVVGIISSGDAKDGDGGVQTPDSPLDVYIPINVMRERFGDIAVRKVSGATIREKVELQQVIVQVNAKEQVESSALAIETMLANFHDKKDYTMRVPLALLRQAEATKRTFNIVLGSIAGISLLVGGIGIMNIMLATVTERTREIGIRRAIGARRGQIILQFLIETVLLSMFGGIIGIFLGLLIPFLITYFADLETIVTWYSIVFSFGISLTVGVIFGLYPAVRAANLNPIEALRHE